MTATPSKCEKDLEELRDLTELLQQPRQSHPTGSRGFVKAGVRKMIAHLHEELAV